MKTSINLNCDVGELDEIDDSDFIPFVSSVNICCGEHAGNPSKILKAIRAAKAHGVKIGAHPSYPDRINFGRKSMELSLEDLRASLYEQIIYLKRLCDREGVELYHVKPHGALYHDVMTMDDRLTVLLEVMKEIDPDLHLYGFADSVYADSLTDREITFVAEGFIDRKYGMDGKLVSRGKKGAVLTDWNDVEHQLDQILTGVLTTHTGDKCTVDCQTICIHSDTPHAGVWMSKIVNHLNKRGVQID